MLKAHLSLYSSICSTFDHKRMAAYVRATNQPKELVDSCQTFLYACNSTHTYICTQHFTCTHTYTNIFEHLHANTCIKYVYTYISETGIHAGKCTVLGLGLYCYQVLELEERDGTCVVTWRQKLVEVWHTWVTRLSLRHHERTTIATTTTGMHLRWWTGRRRWWWWGSRKNKKNEDSRKNTMKETDTSGTPGLSMQ